MAQLILQFPAVPIDEVADLRSQVADLQRIIVALVVGAGGRMYVHDKNLYGSKDANLVIYRDEARRRHELTIDENEVK